ncbi:hypothetical protein F8M41_008757 [Gigaspora margarita]|uniref:Uncharacterized protein n=1 Tax=Gigaspora margarita TaxID=4874 RepID=A0A8H4A4E9_GIGMA|nr:hypothetical protein F8M41_008757 [Gigaspora margarita]
MTKGRPRQNKGPCVICGENASKIFRKLTEESLKIANNSPNTDLIIVDTLKVGDELCQTHYNNLVAFEHAQVKSNKRKKKQIKICLIIQVQLNKLKFLNLNKLIKFINQTN